MKSNRINKKLFRQANIGGLLCSSSNNCPRLLGGTLWPIRLLLSSSIGCNTLVEQRQGYSYIFNQSMHFSKPPLFHYHKGQSCMTISPSLFSAPCPPFLLRLLYVELSAVLGPLFFPWLWSPHSRCFGLGSSSFGDSASFWVSLFYVLKAMSHPPSMCLFPVSYLLEWCSWVVHVFPSWKTLLHVFNQTKASYYFQYLRKSLSQKYLIT